MASIGKFGTKHAVIDLDFDYFDETIRVNPAASQLALVEFLDQAAAVDVNDEVLGAKLIMRLMREAVHPDDFDRFWVIAKRERQSTEEIMALAQAVMEAISGFPTGQPSGSFGGPSTTPQRFTVDLPSQDTPQARLRIGTSSADKALAMLRSRPDLQEFVVLNEEAEAARNGRQVAAG